MLGVGRPSRTTVQAWERIFIDIHSHRLFSWFLICEQWLSGLNSNVLFFPLAAGFDLAVATLSRLLIVRPPVNLALFE